MIEPTCLIFSHRGDEHLRSVLDQFPEGDTPFIIDLRDFGEKFCGSVEFDRTILSFFRLKSGEAVGLSKLKSVWWRRPTYFVTSPDLTEELREFVWREKSLFFDGFLACLPSFVRQYNNPFCQRALDSKLSQLKLAQQVGLSIPETCVTSDPDEARRFTSNFEKVIFKSFWGTESFWQPTRLITSDAAKHFDQLTICPSILQRYVDGIADVRVIAIDKEIFAAEFDIRSSRYPADVRIDTEIPCAICGIDDVTRDRLNEFMSIAGLRYGAFDFRRSADGTLTFFEINSSGQFRYLDNLAGTKISEAMVRALTREDRDSVPAISCKTVFDGAPLSVKGAEPFAALAPAVRHIPARQ